MTFIELGRYAIANVWEIQSVSPSIELYGLLVTFKNGDTITVKCDSEEARDIRYDSIRRELGLIKTPGAETILSPDQQRLKNLFPNF